MLGMFKKENILMVRRLLSLYFIALVMEKRDKFTGMNSIKFNWYFKTEEDCLKYIVKILLDINDYKFFIFGLII